MGVVAARVQSALRMVHRDGSGVGAGGSVGGSAESWWELAGHDGASLVRTCRELWAGARVAAEVGLAFAEQEVGDAADLGVQRWYGGDKLLDGFFAGVGVEGQGVGVDVGAGVGEGVGAGVGGGAVVDGLFAALRVWDMRLVLVDRGGRAVATLDLAGRTMEDAAGWIVDRTMNLLDVGVRRATPVIGTNCGGADADADAVSEADVLNGGVFAQPDQLASAELLRLLSNTSVVLRRLGEALDTKREALCLPVDGLASYSARFGVDGADGAGSGRVFEVGFSPWGLSDAGACWFVRRVDGGQPERAVAVLGVDEVGGLSGVDQQAERLAGFLAASIESAVGNDG